MQDNHNPFLYFALLGGILLLTLLTLFWDEKNPEQLPNSEKKRSSKSKTYLNSETSKEEGEKSLPSQNLPGNSSNKKNPLSSIKKRSFYQPVTSSQKEGREGFCLPKGHRLLFSGKWGSQKGAFGLDPSGPRPGPMGFVLDGQGNLWVLDQENYRIQVFSPDGKWIRTLPLSSNLYENITFDKEKNQFALFNPETHKAEIFSNNGSLLSSLTLPKSNLPVTEIWLYHGKFYVEYGHSKVLEIEENGKRREIPGRPASTEKSFRIKRLNDSYIEIICYALNENTPREVWKKKIHRPNTEIIDFQAMGKYLFLGWRYFKEVLDPEGKRVMAVDEKGVIQLDSQGNLVGELPLHPGGYTDQRKEFQVTLQGEIIQMTTTPEGVWFHQGSP
ncbi:MAG: hypothetical protein D6785_07165 [Planctomycetota bacterium]|nr:MAG: hypothetical protein D6785_07165 [Planctomycetota bacterium]